MFYLFYILSPIRGRKVVLTLDYLTNGRFDWNLVNS